LAYQRGQRLARALAARKTKSESLVHVGEHIAQLCYNNRGYYQQWIFFDDLWASAHRDLANSLLRYVHRWDVLSPGAIRS
jgi:hypothetical protein